MRYRVVSRPAFRVVGVRARVPLVHSLHYFPWVGAAHGSLNVMGFIAASQILPMPLACLVAVWWIFRTGYRLKP